MRSPNDEGPTVAAVAPQEYKQNRTPDCHGADAAWQAEAFRRLQARATPLGLLAHRLRADDDAPAFLVARVSASREFASLDGAVRFVNEWEGRRHG